MTSDLRALPDPDMAATGDGRLITAAINALTERVTALLAEPAAEDERCTLLGDGNALICSACQGPCHRASSVPAPAADGGEVEALADVFNNQHEPNQSDCDPSLVCSNPEHLAFAILASDWLADLRRTERAEGAREAWERIAAAIEAEGGKHAARGRADGPTRPARQARAAAKVCAAAARIAREAAEG